VQDFKDAIFIYEMASVPSELKVMDALAESFKAFPEAQTTRLETADTLEKAAVMIDNFKAITCGSAYSLAVVNLNMMTDIRELEFLMRPNVLGDPRMIFLASLRFMVGDAYAMARDKVQRESEIRGRSPSCIFRYGAANREEVLKPVSEIAAAYLRESEELLKNKQNGSGALVETHVTRILRKSETAFVGSKLNSGVLKSVSPLTPAQPVRNDKRSGRF
jgi:hypothetical protein